ncbi:MAG: hypothetical protein M1820_009527 [Bogoriella megaspora]|nr:MAG: hypothetical protein M1820_009527 [Bogoriella megaspora]
MIPLGVVAYSGAGSALDDTSKPFPLKRPKFSKVKFLQGPEKRPEPPAARSQLLSGAAKFSRSEEARASLESSKQSAPQSHCNPSKSKHIPIVIPRYEPLVALDKPSFWTPAPSPIKTSSSSSASSGSLFLDPTLRERKTSADSGRSIPRHVEIVIPDWAKPVLQLPDTPTSLCISRDELSRSVTPKPFLPGSPFIMTRHNQDGSRSNTIDSNTSAPSPSQLATNRFRNGSQTNLSNLRNASETSLGRNNAYDSTPDNVQINGLRNVTASAQSNGPSPAVQQTAGLGGASNGATTSSGLVCNVHRTTGREPHSLVGASTTILGDKLYVFGGRRLSRSRAQLVCDLYELDLIKRHWTKVETKGDVPPPRYFHSVCALGDTKLVCYGGMCPVTLPAGQTTQNQNAPQEAQPEFMVMSDIHIYDVPTRTWMKIPIPTNESPQGRYAHCATVLPSSGVFASANAPMSAINHNPSTSQNSGSLGVSLDGTGGAEMVVVGGQDSSNHYIEQISVFNLRSLKWTGTTHLGRQCGAYRSVVAPMPYLKASQIGAGLYAENDEQDDLKATDSGSPMLVYSNYNFMDVKLELQIRQPDGSLVEKPMSSQYSPPGLRFPNGAVVNDHFIVSGTFLTSSKQEYSLWALDLRTLQWNKIDAGGNIFNQGSWNRGVLWPRRNTFVVLGNRKRSLVEDYNHRRINFSNVCMVELEAFGLYDNPRLISPTSDFASVSAPPFPYTLNRNSNIKSTSLAGGRKLWPGAEDLGMMALDYRELADMDFLAIGGERIPVNSHLVARRWGPYFIQLLKESAAADTATTETETATLRPGALTSYPSRNSSLTITPAGVNAALSGSSPTPPATSSGAGIRASVATSSSTGTTLANSTQSSSFKPIDASKPTNRASLTQPPDPRSSPPASRPRTLYLPHTAPTLRTLLTYLYTSTLPPATSPDSSPQILCSLLQLARPYRVDGLLEAVVERLHEVLDGRNTAAIFNASAMAAGGGEGVAFLGQGFSDRRASQAGGDGRDGSTTSAVGSGSVGDRLRINTALTNGRGVVGGGRSRAGSNVDPAGMGGVEDGTDEEDRASSVSDTTSASELSSAGGLGGSSQERNGEVWMGGLSSVVGLQKRGLRGLMEGRRMRERGRSDTAGTGGSGSVGLGIA